MNEEYVRIIRSALDKMNFSHVQIEEFGKECYFGNICIEYYPGGRNKKFYVWAKGKGDEIIYSKWTNDITDAAIAGVVQLIIQDLEEYMREDKVDSP